MATRRYLSLRSLETISLALLLAAEKIPAGMADVFASSKPESEFKRQRRLKREAKKWPKLGIVETLSPHDMEVRRAMNIKARQDYGPPKSDNQRRRITKQHHRSRGRGR